MGIEAQEKQYVALVPMSGKIGTSSWTVKEGRPVSNQIISFIGGADRGLEKCLICLKSEYENIIAKKKKADYDAMKKGEDARNELIKKRKARAKKEALENAGVTPSEEKKKG
jgi:hypothetical protein